MHDPTLIGTVQDVSGSTVTVELHSDTVTGLSFVNGESYRIGQVGSFVKIPIGLTELFGVVSQVGAGAAPISADGKNEFGNRWLRVQLVGEGRRSGRFQRGISQYPTIDDRVHIVTERDLLTIYGPGAPDDFVDVGTLASAEAIPALVDINKLVTRHSAVVGTTGAGKSTTVAGVLSALSDPTKYPSARILLLDLHGEYSRALSDRCVAFRIGAINTPSERELHIPYWALSFEEFVPFALGDLKSEAQIAAVADLVLTLKRESLATAPLSGVNSAQITVDSPVPFCIHKLWFELHRRENETLVPKPGGATEERMSALVMKDDKPVQAGDAMTVTPPLYRTVKTTGPAPERVQHGGEGVGMRQQVAFLASRLRDPRFSFLFSPGEWSPDINGQCSRDLDSLLEQWIGGPNPVTVLDLSGIPSTILNDLIGALLRVVYDTLFWARNLPEGGRERPLLLVLEEAHAYLGKDKLGSAAMAVRRIAKEGRKYGVGMMLVSQRPSEIDSTVLSQCGTIFAMRLANDSDRGHVTGAAADNLKGLLEMLPVLRTGEAVIVGEAVALPIRALIHSPPPERRPDSSDPRVAVRGDRTDGFDGPGGWNQVRDPSDYKTVVRQWRHQQAKYKHQQHN